MLKYSDTVTASCAVASVIQGTSSCTSPSVPAGAVCSLTCNRGYAPETGNEATCQADGTFDVTLGCGECFKRTIKVFEWNGRWKWIEIGNKVLYRLMFKLRVFWIQLFRFSTSDFQPLDMSLSSIPWTRYWRHNLLHSNLNYAQSNDRILLIVILEELHWQTIAFLRCCQTRHPLQQRRSVVLPRCSIREVHCIRYSYWLQCKITLKRIVFNSSLKCVFF